MNYYGAKELAAAFRKVRHNTLIVAEEIQEDQYGFRAATGVRSVKELLTHIAMGSRFQEAVTLDPTRLSMAGFDYMGLMDGIKAESEKVTTKDQVLALLKTEGEKFASAVERLTDEFLGQSLPMPPGGDPPSRTRFDMLMSVKEHEMHHRGQLMLIERMLGIKPHLTRAQEARIAAMREAAAVKA
jgi:uncharacterized damage-inducible protein DinB